MMQLPNMVLRDAFSTILVRVWWLKVVNLPRARNLKSMNKCVVQFAVTFYPLFSLTIYYQSSHFSSHPKFRRNGPYLSLTLLYFEILPALVLCISGEYSLNFKQLNLKKTFSSRGSTSKIHLWKITSKYLINPFCTIEIARPQRAHQARSEIIIRFV